MAVHIPQAINLRLIKGPVPVVLRYPGRKPNGN